MKKKQLMLLVLLLAGNVTARAADVEKMDASVVRIIVEVGDDFSTGSGVIVSSQGVVLTNAHVVEDYRRIMVITGSGDDYERYNAKLLWRDRNKDIALLQVSEINRPPAVIVSGKPQKGSKVFAIGFPSIADDLSSGNSLIESTISEGVIGRIVSAPITENSNKVELIQHSAPINAGNSGGGLFNSCGQLIGINTFIAKATIERDGDDYVVSQNSGMGVAVSIVEVQKAFENIGIEISYTSACDVNSESIIPSSVSEAERVMPNGGNTSSTSNKDDKPVFIYAVVILTLGLAITALIASMRKPKNVSDSHTNWLRKNNNNNQISSDSGYRSYQLLGKNSLGANFELSINVSKSLNPPKVIVIGRDKSVCDYVINDPTVSRRHIELILKPEQTLIRDLNSTNGTKVGKLKVNENWLPLSVGDSITLGKVSTIFMEMKL